MRPLTPWRLEPTLRFLALLPLALAVGGLGVELLSRAILSAPGERPAWLLALGTGILHATALLLLVPLLRAHGMGWREAFGGFDRGLGRRWLLAAGLTLPALLAAWLLHQGSGWILDRLAIPQDNQMAVEAVRNAGRWWERGLLFTFAVISAPIAEEILFRGVLWPLVRETGWQRTGMLGVGLLFALIHLNAAALLPLWFLGCFWAWLYERTGDLTAPILSHGLFNATNFFWIVLSSSPSAP